MAALAQTPGSFIPSAGAQFTNQRYVFGATVLAGQPCYLDASNLIQLALNDTAAHAAVAGFAELGGSAGQSSRLLISDPNLVPGSTLVIGDTLWLYSTAGTYTKTAGDLGSGKVTTFLGVAKSTTVLNYPGPATAGVAT
jgi:hypothetical protein